MMMRNSPLYLTLLSALPFIALSGMIAMHMDQQTILLHFLMTYAAVILSFLGGIHWGLAVLHYPKNPNQAVLMLFESIVPPLLAWSLMLVDQVYLRLLSFAFLYALVWGIDSVLYNHKIIPQWFFNLRCVVTPIVVVSIYVAYFSII